MQAQSAGRDTINIVGSSTVYPFATVVAEKFGKVGNVPRDRIQKSAFKRPIMESKKVVNVQKYFCPERLRPKYNTFERQPLFIMTSEG